MAPQYQLVFDPVGPGRKQTWLASSLVTRAAELSAQWLLTLTESLS